MELHNVCQILEMGQHGQDISPDPIPLSLGLRLNYPGCKNVLCFTPNMHNFTFTVLRQFATVMTTETGCPNPSVI